MPPHDRDRRDFHGNGGSDAAMFIQNLIAANRAEGGKDDGPGSPTDVRGEVGALHHAKKAQKKKHPPMSGNGRCVNGDESAGR